MNSVSYDDGLTELQQLNRKLAEAHFDYEHEMAFAIKNCPSKLNSFDFTFSITIGILAAVLDTNKKVADFLNEVHELASKEDIASDNKLQELLGKMLHHQGDWMDKVPTDKINKSGKNLKSYISRYADEVADGIWSAGGPSISGPHRLFWGHDIFSIKGDNPFTLLIKEYGIGRGILQAVRHLVADTCSHQGLVLPGSSFFDYIEVSTNQAGQSISTVKNGLLDFCQQYSKETLGKKQCGFDNMVFNHLLSIHMQDILSSGMVATMIAVYCKSHNITDKTRKVQMRVIGYMGVTFGSAIIGAAQHGIPYINWPAFYALAKNTMQMIHITNTEVKSIMIETERLMIKGNTLEVQEHNLNTELLTDLYGTLTVKNKNSGRDSLIDFLGEVK